MSTAKRGRKADMASHVPTGADGRLHCFQTRAPSSVPMARKIFPSAKTFFPVTVGKISLAKTFFLTGVSSEEIPRAKARSTCFQNFRWSKFSRHARAAVGAIWVGTSKTAPKFRRRSRKIGTSTSRAPVSVSSDRQAASPAAWPMLMVWPMLRHEAWASCVAEKHRPTTQVVPAPRGMSVR